MKKIIITTISVILTSTAFAQMPPPPVRETMQMGPMDINNARDKLLRDQTAYQNTIDKQRWAESHGDMRAAQWNNNKAQELYIMVQDDKRRLDRLEHRMPPPRGY